MIKKETIIRTAILVIALINQILTSAGKSVLPIDDQTVTQLISVIFTVLTSMWAWWKNNSFTKEAIEADKKLKELKESGKQ